MSTPQPITGKTQGGEFVPDNPEAWARAFARKDGTPMVVTPKRLVPKRSGRANAYWWACVIPMFMDEVGIKNKYAMHAILLEELGHYDLIPFGKGTKKVIKETKDLPADDFANLIDTAGQLFQDMYGGRLPPVDSKHADAMMAGA